VRINPIELLPNCHIAKVSSVAVVILIGTHAVCGTEFFNGAAGHINHKKPLDVERFFKNRLS